MTKDHSDLEVVDLGLLDYDNCLNLQQDMVLERIADKIPDRLLLVSHPSVISIGKSGGANDLLVSSEELHKRDIRVVETDRGGKTTFHGPGQLVVYPVLKLKDRDIHSYVRDLLQVVLSVLEEYGVKGELRPGTPGVWVGERKIASIGISVRKWVAYHGIALNVSPELSNFDLFVPCGTPGQPVTSMERELGRPLNLHEVGERFTKHFKAAFGYRTKEASRYPDWLRVRDPGGKAASAQVEKLMGDLKLETVCQSARCPNIGECFSRGTATFLILGRYCTRNCRFCAVEHGNPDLPDPLEPERVASAVRSLSLTHAVITSVTRDDLADGGARHYAETIVAIRHASDRTAIEVLVPDFQGDQRAIAEVCAMNPEVFNHNMETVRRLSPLVRPEADYHRSLRVLTQASQSGLAVKSGLMLGLGETEDEMKETLTDLLEAGCRQLTLGQYLPPSRNHFPVSRYLHPEEFERWAAAAGSMGFHNVAAAPLVRSSYHAEHFFREKKENCR